MQTSLPGNFFHSHLNMEDITDADCAYVKRVYKDFEINNLGEYHDLYAHSDTLLLADVFQNFQNICVKTNKFNPATFLTVPGLARQGALKKTKVKSDLLTGVDMLLIPLINGIRGIF